MSLAKPLAWALLSCALSTALPSWSHADEGGDMNIQAFRPALDSKGLITLEGSDLLAPGDLSFGLVTHWGRGLVSLEDDGNQYELEHLLSPTLVGAIGFKAFGQDLQLSLALPFRIASGDRGPDSNNGTPDDPNDDHDFRFKGQGVGNVAAQLKWRLMNTSRHPVGLTLIAGADLPTTSASSEWLGADTTIPYGRIVVDKELGRLRLSANAGVHLPLDPPSFTDDTPPIINDVVAPMTGQTISSGVEFPLGIGMSYDLSPQRISLVSELIANVAPSAENYRPVEALAGLKVYLAQSSFLSLGAGTGLSPGTPGSPSVRAFMGIVFEPNIGDRDRDGLKDDVDRCPLQPEDYDDFEDGDGCPEPDNDRDLILDIDDQCPLDPEDKDGDEDEDGCPEHSPSDRDGDLIMDDEDECPDDPEDFDQFQDEDGCPDVDNDSDRILDVDDLCPDDPEDYDAFEDTDGCPDPDNDGDRILDADDECPRIDGETAEETREVYNTVDDEDGCPDRGPVRFGDGEILVLKKIHFEYNRADIKSQSFAILDAVAMTIISNPDLKLVEIQGHTDERGSAEYNLELSRRRAASVVEYLAAKGVEEHRLEPVGYGESRPKIKKSNEQAWAANRRVEFIIRKRD